ncbi:Rha family transcriptional regulator [Pseudomonas sp. ANT_J12]|uniref:phage regulatory CII family protein n=1 Tax=Pseudomonas sp. ANT_J12 TaxID=2597351 RepID=UPI0011F0F57B|nr:phage regulatory CII family protein [Pseudomonas sp. ANT_J12]KAA0995472.1 Rha family transcriptional regulator [Pseudomonas sp. ANT_J12]
MEEFERTLHREVKADGGTALAKRMGVNETTLLDCANPNRANHKMNIQMLGMVLTHLPLEGRLSVLGALANQFECDVMLRKRPEPKPLMAALCHLTAECGDVGRLIFDAASDNHISQHEKAQGDKAIQEAIDALHVLRESLKAA